MLAHLFCLIRLCSVCVCVCVCVCALSSQLTSGRDAHSSSVTVFGRIPDVELGNTFKSVFGELVMTMKVFVEQNLAPSGRP